MRIGNVSQNFIPKNTDMRPQTIKTINDIPNEDKEKDAGKLERLSKSKEMAGKRGIAMTSPTSRLARKILANFLKVI
jgi:hypothetical protein